VIVGAIVVVDPSTLTNSLVGRRGGFEPGAGRVRSPVDSKSRVDGGDMIRGKVLAIAGTVVLSAALLAAGSGTLSSAGAAPSVITKKITISSTCSGPLFCFVPMNKSVGAGVQVVWTNTTFAPHQLALCNVTACSGVTSGTGTQTGFGSPSIGMGGTYAFTFTGLGTYTYYCTIHGYMTMHGTITVDAAPTIAGISPTSIARGSSNVSFSVTGTGFRGGVKAKVSGPGVTVSSVVRVNSTHLTLTISAAPTAPVGKRTFTVTNTDGGRVMMARAISVT
jgi:plastocyanin